MARQRKSSPGAKLISGFVTVVIFVALGPALLAVFAVVFAVFLIAKLVANALGFGKCQLCSSSLKRASYTWSIDGTTKRVCPTCSRNLQNKASKDAVNRALKHK